MNKKVVPILFFCLFLSPFMLNAQLAVTNQRLYDTIPNMPAHYEKRVALFEKEPVKTGRIIFLGNSITEGGKWAQLTGDTTIINRGISGDITFGVLRRLDDITKRQPAKLFILIGINDIGMDIPDDVIADNYRKIIQAVQKKSPATKIYVQSLLPLNPDVKNFPQHYDKQEHVLKANQLIKKVAAETKAQFIDIFSLFLDSQKRLDARYTYDGLHLNQAGYERWAKHLKQKGYL
ncbi:GDSL-type esterase/lipase family protein [Rhodocytophaga aerolata]|uniref:GDSL-type esterase/lipase family protein n=1 Tax=Rhodocytophaga aerolata TaxID=455078 RepID=A0ABT8R184_9BACT|nr:GDSL-type esterase/lipase family protein [Rhodocytophaga aerolata]MDO1445073.1 GDSL-type esterase/lipase family protein [Rhodocytophaga aerolata]